MEPDQTSCGTGLAIPFFIQLEANFRKSSFLTDLDKQKKKISVPAEKFVKFMHEITN